MHKYKLGELGSLKRALQARDGEIAALQGRLDNEQHCAGPAQTCMHALLFMFCG